jgi:hypothetical protein
LAVLFLLKPFTTLREWDSTKLCWSMLLGGIAFSTLGEISSVSGRVARVGNGRLFHRRLSDSRLQHAVGRHTHHVAVVS